uniref:Uncharacterized protein n=1 Tax=viral metagenome TaxID=1070528 RepID=A0A6C0E3G2_9ZZZZ
MSYPFHNINGSLVNVDGSNYAGSAFTSRVLPNTVNPNVLPEPLNKGEAANSYIPGCMKGGKINKRKIKNISNMYKMRRSRKQHVSKMKRRILKKYSRKMKKSKRTNTKSKSRKQRGGYAQYQNNLPMTQTYSLGGKLDPSMSALASPPPQKVLSNCTNCVDNYSYFKNSGFPSRGWW